MARNVVELVGKFRDQMTGKMSKVGSAMRKLGSMARTGAIGVGILATAVMAAAKQLSDYGAAIYDTHAAAGIGIQDAQALSYGLVQAGGSADSLGKALRTQARFMGAVNDGMAIQTEMLGELGFQYSDFEGLTPDQIFIKLSDAIGQVEDATMRTEYAMTIFGGRGASAVLAAIEEFDGSISNAVAAFDELGYSLTDEQVTNLKHYSDAMTDLGFRMKSFLADAIVPMLPGIENMIEKFMELGEERLPMLIEMAEKAIPILAGIVDIANLVGEGWSKLTGGDAQTEIDRTAEALTNLANSLEGQVAAGMITATEAAIIYRIESEQLFDAYGGNAMETEILRSETDKLAISFNLATAALREMLGIVDIGAQFTAIGESMQVTGMELVNILVDTEGLMDAINSYVPPDVVPDGSGMETLSAKVIAELQAQKDEYHQMVEDEIAEIQARDEAEEASAEARRQRHIEEKEERRMMAELEAELHQTRLEQAEEYLQATETAMSYVMSTMNAFYAYNSQKIAQERKEAIAKVNATVQDEEKKKEMIAKINAKYDQKEKDAKEQMKPVKVAQAISNVALGVTQALASGPPPWNFIQAGLVAAAGAAEVATITSQKYAGGGWVKGNGNTDTVHAMLTPGELVLTPDQAKMMVAAYKEQKSQLKVETQPAGGATIINYSPLYSDAGPADMARFTEVVVKAGKKAGKW